MLEGHLANLNGRLKFMKLEGVERDFNALVEHVDGYREKADAIGKDGRFTERGRTEARTEAAKAALEAIEKWKSKVAGLQKHAASIRGALLNIDAAATKPTDRAIDHLLSRLRDFDPLQISIFYTTASDEERRLLEACSQSVGRIPTKTKAGGLKWQSMLEPEVVGDAIMMRCAAEAPEKAEQLAEVQSLAEVYETVLAVASKEIRDAAGIEAKPKLKKVG